MASGQAVRRLTLDQEIVGSNPTSPAKAGKWTFKGPFAGLVLIVG